MRTVNIENVNSHERVELENKRGMVFFKLEAPKVAKEGTRPAILFFEEIDNHRSTLLEAEVAQIWDAITTFIAGNSRSHWKGKMFALNEVHLILH